MKTLLILLSINLFANELQWVNEQIKAIQPPREGISKSKINLIRSPFIFFEEPIVVEGILKDSTENEKVKTASIVNNNVTQEQEIQLRLEAIMNKSALINGKWYRLQNKVGKYTLENINKEKVILSIRKKKLLLSLKHNNKNLKFKIN